GRIDDRSPGQVSVCRKLLLQLGGSLCDRYSLRNAGWVGRVCLDDGGYSADVRDGRAGTGDLCLQLQQSCEHGLCAETRSAQWRTEPGAEHSVPVLGTAYVCSVGGERI